MASPSTTRRHAVATLRRSRTAEDVKLSLQALAPFCAGSDPSVGIEAGKQVGDAVLVRNFQPRFANRDATKHANEVNSAELPRFVDDATKALRGGAE